MHGLRLGRWTRRTATLLLSMGCASGPGPGAPNGGMHPEAIPGPLATRLQAEIDAWGTDTTHRGVSAAVILEDGREWVAAAGVEGTGARLTPDHHLWIASITKTMTGAVVLQLAHEGVLGLDDPVSRWLDPIPNVDAAITIRQLLNHTNGLANYTRSPEVLAAMRADSTHIFSASELVGSLGSPVFPPGARTQYTNTAFVLLGMIAVAATRRPITELWSERLWQPLGLHDVFLPGLGAATGPVARAWAGAASDQEVAPLTQMSLLSLGNSAFGLFSNARTVARWGRALFAGAVLDEEMRTAMLEFVPAAGNIPGESGTGLGIRKYSYLEREQWGHSGGSPLGSSLLLYDGQTGIIVVVLMNQGAHADHFLLAPRLLAIAAGER